MKIEKSGDVINATSTAIHQLTAMQRQLHAENVRRITIQEAAKPPSTSARTASSATLQVTQNAQSR